MSPLIQVAVVTVVVGSAWLWVALKQCAPVREQLGSSYYHTALAVAACFYLVSLGCFAALALH